jgi:hypothetical protein
MNRLRAWEQELLTEVGLRIEKYGFDKRPKGQSFAKKNPLGRFTFHLTIIKHEDDLDVTADLAIRFDRVEDLVNLYENHPLVRESDKANTHTLGCELGNISEGRQKRWTIASANDIPPVADSILDSFTTVALPYFEQFSNPERVLDILSGDGPDSWLHSPFHDARAKRAVALSLQLKGKEAADQLAKAKLAFLEGRKEPSIASFRAFLEKLAMK